MTRILLSPAASLRVPVTERRSRAVEGGETDSDSGAAAREGGVRGRREVPAAEPLGERGTNEWRLSCAGVHKGSKSDRPGGYYWLSKGPG
jgi:hypothetical protein